VAIIYKRPTREGKKKVYEKKGGDLHWKKKNPSGTSLSSCQAYAVFNREKGKATTWSISLNRLLKRGRKKKG